VKLTALLVAWLVEPITVPVGFGVGVGAGGEVGVGCGVGGVGGCVGRGVGELEGVGVLCGRFPPLPQPSSSLSLCPLIEVNPSDGSSSVRDGDRVGLRGDRAKLIPPTVTTVTMPTAPTAISLSSCLRFCGAGHGRERASDFARRAGG
jgi:hypothetical protein